MSTNGVTFLRNCERPGFFILVVAGIGAVVATPALLSAAGFTGAGVAAGSAAAVWHSTIGNVVAGSAFSILQSAGAAGVAVTTKVIIGGAAALLAAIV